MASSAHAQTNSYENETHDKSKNAPAPTVIPKTMNALHNEVNWEEMTGC